MMIVAILAACTGRPDVALDASTSSSTDTSSTSTDSDTSSTSTDSDTSSTDSDTSSTCGDGDPLVEAVGLACVDGELVASWSVSAAPADLRVTLADQAGSQSATWQTGELDGSPCCGSYVTTWRPCSTLGSVDVTVEAIDVTGNVVSCASTGGGACPVAPYPTCEG